MKKVKGIFTAAAIFAVVGSALAFKSAFVPDLYFCDLSGDPTCKLNPDQFSTQDPGTGTVPGPSYTVYQVAPNTLPFPCDAENRCAQTAYAGPFYKNQ